MEDFAWLLPAIVTAAAAWGGVRQGMNGQRETIERLGTVLDRVGTKVDAHAERIAAIEADKDNLKELIRNVEKRRA